MFAMAIPLSDGLLKIKEEMLSGATGLSGTATEVSMELQVVLCRRSVGSRDLKIPVEQRELAVRQLARQILSSNQVRVSWSLTQLEPVLDLRREREGGILMSNQAGGGLGPGPCHMLSVCLSDARAVEVSPPPYALLNLISV